MQVTLLELRTRARDRANQEVGNFVTDSNLNGYINASAAELYDLLTEKYGSYYFSSNYVFALTNGVNEYALPDDFYKLIGAEMVIPGGLNVTMQRFNWGDRNQMSMQGVLTWYDSAPWYALTGNRMRLMPVPQSPYSISLDYVPLLARMVSDSDTINGFNGWEEYIVVDAAIKCLSKEQEDVSVLMAEKAGLMARIESAAANRDAANSGSITNVNNQNGIYPFGRY